MKKKEYKYHELRVKIKSLADEAKIIRKEIHKVPILIKEQKQVRLDFRGQLYYDSNQHLRNSLYRHNEDVVAVHARAALLAYTFFNGNEYQIAEPKLKKDKFGNFVNPPNFGKVRNNVKNFSKGNKDQKAEIFLDLEEWIDRARNYINAQKETYTKAA